MNIGAAIDRLHELKDEQTALEKQLRDIKKRRDEMEINVTALFMEQGVTLSRGTTATASITETIYPVAENWDDFYDHIQETGDFHLLERRPSAAAFRELLASGETVPGLKSFTKRKLSLRKN